MSKTLPLIIAPDPLLKQESIEVDAVTPEIQKLMDEMLQTMYHEQGVGLAAVQVGVLKRVLVMDVNYSPKPCDGNHDHHDHSHVQNPQPIFMVNPKIIKSSKEEATYKEGCLSFPEAAADVIRPEKVTVEYLDYDGNKQNINAEGLLATCVQHEIDHLNGITFVDHLSRLKREMIIKKMKKFH